MRKSLYRPSRTPTVDVPLGARSVGHYVIEEPYRETPLAKHFVQIFWGVRGRGAIVIDGEERLLEPERIALYFPGMTHIVYSLGELWEYRWWTMDGPLAEANTAAFGLGKADIYEAGPAPEALFDALEAAVGDVTPDGERHASDLAYQLLASAAGCRRRTAGDALVQRAIRMLEERWDDPATTVQALADRLEQDRSLLTRRFRAHTGVSPIRYLTGLRMRHALAMLKQTDLPVGEVARACGYEDPNYFARCVRKSTGRSPREFRRL